MIARSEITCRLTGEKGKPVKSHLIPRALAPPKPNGLVTEQFGNGERPVRRRDSWYDRNLVTAKGEKILESLDDFAIKELRETRLVWQSWDSNVLPNTQQNEAIAGTPYSVRSISFSDGERMRIFFLSLLWRATETDLREFNEISIRNSQRRKLRQILLDHAEPPDDFFPVTLTQLSTIGPSHNQSPIADYKRIPRLGSRSYKEMKIFRFYFDGLVVHFHREPGPQDMAGLGNQIVARNAETTVITVPFEASWQKENLDNLIEESEALFPGQLPNIS